MPIWPHPGTCCRAILADLLDLGARIASLAFEIIEPDAPQPVQFGQVLAVRNGGAYEIKMSQERLEVQLSQAFRPVAMAEPYIPRRQKQPMCDGEAAAQEHQQQRCQRDGM